MSFPDDAVDPEEANALAFYLALNPGMTFGDIEVSVSDRVREQYRAARDFFAKEYS